jgi:hypothetical protein
VGGGGGGGNAAAEAKNCAQRSLRGCFAAPSARASVQCIGGAAALLLTDVRRRQR